MRYVALATDYDGTLADDGHVGDDVADALVRLRGSGRRVILVTGRELPELISVCKRLDLFDLVVAENGALLYRPSDRAEETLGCPPPDEFLLRLRRRDVAPFSQGRVIFATWRPHETAVLETIRDLGIEYHVIFNKRAVMVLPSGINKASGLAEALARLGLDPDAVVGVGDAENDHALLDLCGVGVAVSNAIPALMERADLVTAGDHGRGVIELIDRMLDNDLSDLSPRPRKRAAAMPAVAARHAGE